jgi:poly(glycerol-phosphate) alpha-glucosyltransferase
MNIGILTPSLTYRGGGIASAVQGLARALSASSATIPSVFGIERAGGDAAWPGARLCPPFGPAAFGYSPSLLKALRAANLDLLHVLGLWMYPSVAAPCWSRRERKPYIVSPQGMLDPWALRNSAWKKRMAARFYERRHLEGAACLHALNPAEAGAIRAFGLRNPVCVIPNGVDLPAGPAPEPPDWARQSAPDTRVLLFLGRLHPKKGLWALLRAWASARIWTSSWRLAVAGWGRNGHAAELARLCRTLRIEESVSFLGPQFGVQKLASYAAARAFILPSLSEGLPVAVLEAWSHRLPVLMTAQCNLPEGFEAGAALPIEPAAESIAAGLRTLASLSDSALAEIGLRGRRLVERKFTWSAVAAQLRAVYNAYV